MSSEKYSKKFEVYYYEVNRFKEAGPVTILNYLEETAISHSSAVGLGIDKLVSDGIGWLLNRWVISMNKYPLYGENIKVETWPSSFERFHAQREFVIKGEDDGIIGCASSFWIFINIEKKRPARIPPNFGELYGLESSKALVPEPLNMEISPEKSIEKEFYVKRSDIDTNNHVNNKKYVGWMMETIPEEVYNNFMLSCLDVEYRKEMGSGCVASKCSAFNFNEKENACFIHQILDRSTGNEVVKARTEWIRR